MKLELDSFNIMYLIMHLFDIFLTWKLFETFIGGEKKSKKICVIAYFIYYILTSAIFILFNIPILNLIVSIVAFAIVSLTYETDYKHRLSGALFVYLSLFIVETFVAVVTGYYDASFIERGTYENYWGLALMRIFAYIETVIISHYKEIKRGMPISGINWLVTFFVPVATMYIELVFLRSDNVTILNAIISTTIVLLLNFVCIHMYNSLAASYHDKMSLALAQQQKDFYLNQCEMMQESSEQLRAFQHDMKNQLYVVKHLCDEGMNDKASQVLNQYVENIDNSKLYCNTGNLIFDSIINYKLQNAKMKEIQTFLEASIPPQLELEDGDIVIIMGNLLDNAIRAASEAEEKRLWLDINYDRGRLLLNIKNTYSGNIEYKNGVIETTKTDKKNHGYGLSNVRKAVDKYSGQMEITHEDKHFCVQIILYC